MSRKTDQAAAIKRIRTAARKRAEHERKKREATEEMVLHVMAAIDAGLGITEISTHAGVSRQAIYDLLER